MIPGPRNLITDVDGLAVGNAEDSHVLTGTTVVLPDAPAIAGVAVHGGAPGTRETDLLDPSCRVPTIDGICLSGGSVYGVGAGDAVVQWLRDEDRGFRIGPELLVPIVPGAIIFDLTSGGAGDWDTPPWPGLARQACAAADRDFALGNAGAGLGARAGRIKGGLGSASAVDPASGLQVGALIVANPVGSVLMPDGRSFWAWPLEQNGEFGGRVPQAQPTDAPLDIPAESRLAGNTTIGVVATNFRFDKADMTRIAMMAHDGLARAIRPVHTPFDGDTIFALSTGVAGSSPADAMTLARVGAIAADCVARAIGRAVYEAKAAGGVPAWSDL